MRAHRKPATQLCVRTVFAVCCWHPSWPTAVGGALGSQPTVPRLWNVTVKGVQSLNCQRAPWHVLGPRGLALCRTFPGRAPWISTEQMTRGQENNPESIQFTRHHQQCCYVFLFVLFRGDVMLQSDGLSFCGSLYGWSVFLQLKLVSCGALQGGGKE